LVSRPVGARREEDDIEPIVSVFARKYDDFAARIPALPGCGASGPTADDAVRNAQEAFVTLREGEWSLREVLDHLVEVEVRWMSRLAARR
jgi:predicted RNase H-like HicB family nuclease